METLHCTHLPRAGEVLEGGGDIVGLGALYELRAGAVGSEEVAALAARVHA